MTVAEVAGYAAAALVFATFYMRTMIPLRVVGIASNIAFLLYGSMAGLVPILVLHGALLPLNLWRLQQIRSLVREVRRTAAGDLPIEVLMPFMAIRHAAAGDILSRRGEAARELYYLASGAIRLLELDKTLTPGALLGEISLFAPTSERTATATAICDSDIKLYTITADKVMQLYHQNPRFGFHVVRLITARTRRVWPGSCSPAVPPVLWAATISRRWPKARRRAAARCCSSSSRRRRTSPAARSACRRSSISRKSARSTCRGPVCGCESRQGAHRLLGRGRKAPMPSWAAGCYKRRAGTRSSAG